MILKKVFFKCFSYEVMSVLGVFFMLSLIYTSKQLGVPIDSLTKLEFYESIDEVPVSPDIITSLNHLVLEVRGKRRTYNRLTVLMLNFHYRERILDEIYRKNGGFLLHTSGVFDAFIFHSNDFRSTKGVVYYKTYDSNLEINATVDKPMYSIKIRRKSSKRYYPPSNHIESLARASLRLGELIENIKPDIIYAPLRGAYPLLRLLLLSSRVSADLYFPATSSFIWLQNRKINGHYFNRMMLRELKDRNILRGRMVYIDEIVSGNMIRTHTIHMIGRPDSSNPQGILLDLIEDGKLKLYVIGVADRHGERMRRQFLEDFKKWRDKGLLKFYIVPVRHLCTEDNIPLLGIHYLDYSMGPRILSIKPNEHAWRAYKNFWITIENTIEQLETLRA